MIPEQMAGMLAGYLQRNLLLLLPGLALLYLLRQRGLAPLLPALAAAGSFWRQLGAGLLLALGGLLAVVGAAWLAGGFASGTAEFRTFSYLVKWPDGGSWLVLGWLFSLQSLWEELLFRCIGVGGLAWLLYWLAGFLLTVQASRPDPAQLWRRWLWCGLAANAVVSLAFASAHGANANVSPLALVNIALAGLVLGQLFVNSASLAAPWAYHFAWNFGQVLLGLPVSGFAIAPAVSVIGFNGARTGFLSGGRFGPEGSVFATLLLAALFGWMVWTGFRRQPPQPADSASLQDGVEAARLT